MRKQDIEPIPRVWEIIRYDTKMELTGYEKNGAWKYNVLT